MARSDPATLRRVPRWILLALAAVVTTSVPVATAFGSVDARSPRLRAAETEDPTVTATKQALDRFWRLWDENRLAELVPLHYTDDSLMLPPNHEPIRGRAGILKYLQDARDTLGKIDPGDFIVQMIPSGNGQVSVVGQANFEGGRLRFTTHEFYQRQVDGSVRNMVDMFGLRDPLR
jgi:ketosteroid isomerase-like protein